MALEPGQLLSHYRLIEKIGEGGMGVVWRAEDVALSREVAIKLLPDEVGQDPERLARLTCEAKAVAALSHPNIVVLYSIEEAEGRRFLCMELVEGRTLAEVIPEGGLPVGEFLRIAVSVAEAVSAAHRRGISHRDLKPRNVVLGREGQVKVLDFGLAHSPYATPESEVSDLPTRTQAQGGFTGTLAYMSPEQIQGLPVGPVSDVFSLGVVLYEMATGRRPFLGRNAAALITSILRDDPIPPTRLNDAYPPRLDRLVSRCLEKDPAHRLPTAHDLLWELELLRGEVGAERARGRAIAVLPFADLSREKDQDYFCEGVAEEIIIALSKVTDLRVAARTSSFRLRDAGLEVREIGRSLGVGAVLQGSVRRAGERLRVTAELVDARDGFEIWADKYDREVKDVFAIQDEIAASIVAALKVSLSAQERQALQKPSTTDVAAYDYYLRARKYFYGYSRKGMRFAAELFSRAIDEDPAYARAFAGIADCSAFLYSNAGRHPEDLERAEVASRKALELDPDLAEAHASHGVALSLKGQHAEAEEEFARAIRMNPVLFEAHYFHARDAFAQGKREEAAAAYEEAMRVRPEDYQSPLLVAQIYADLGRGAEAEAARWRGVRRAEEQLRLNPDDVRALYMGANGLVALGETARGLEWADRALALDPDEAMLLYNIACIKALAGASEDALSCLERALAAGFALTGWLEHDSNLDSIRDHPRFRAVLEGLRR
jgi:TolB-like protein/cytochrome c-type biogenesis protein CcmH/NrfG